jgi:hypothetical protein
MLAAVICPLLAWEEQDHFGVQAAGEGKSPQKGGWGAVIEG